MFWFIVQSYRGRDSEFGCDQKTDISENRASRNFDLMIIKWCLLKITLQAPFLNVKKTFDRSRSSLGLQAMSSQNCKTTTMNSQVQSWFQKLFLSQDSYITTRVGITIPPSYSNAEDNRMKKKCMDKGSKERSPPHNLRQKPGQYICCQNHKLIADIENDILDIRSQDGKDDKDNDKGSKSRSQSMKEQAYNK
ncbi:hypothetical protein Tco_0881516 [Tanacetum coccineum]